jgi:hypothetical protein
MLYAALNPRGLKPEVELLSMAPRLPELRGKVVYCVSQYVGGADTFLQKVAAVLPNYAPGAKTVYRRKPASYGTDDPELWEEITREADAVIYGSAA